MAWTLLALAWSVLPVVMVAAIVSEWRDRGAGGAVAIVAVPVGAVLVVAALVWASDVRSGRR